MSSEIIHETQLSRTNRATHLCKCNGVADIKTHPSPYVLSWRIWSFCVKGCVGIDTGEPPKLGSLEPRLYWDERRGWPQDIGPPHLCYNVNFGSSALKDVGINTEPRNWGALELSSLGMGVVVDPIRYTPPQVLPRQIWQFCDKGCTNK